MKKLVLLFAVLMAFPMVYAQTTEVEGVAMDNAIDVEGNSLMLNGAGLREKFWIDLYVGGLYLSAKSSDAETIIDADMAMAMKLHIVSDRVTQEKMVNAVEEGFEKATGGDTASIADRIVAFKALFGDEIVGGDVFTIAYVPGTGTIVYKNGTKVGSVAGLDFKQALFAIWLGKKPADKDVKKGMLGM